MASGSSSGRNNSGPKGYDFASDDILCSYEDYANQENSNGVHSSDPVGANSSKEFHKSRMAKSAVYPASSYSPPEESINHDVIATVELTMKKYADNLMRFLEGISSRLSQLELYCYNLDKSIGEMRSELARDNGEADSKLKFLEKHLQEVHRSVQILRDKQELAETQKELAKIQLAQKESNSATHSQQGEERASPPASDPKKNDNTSDAHSQQLALALPSQVPPQPSVPARPVEHHQQPMPQQPPQNVTPAQGYYLPSVQLSNLPPSMQPSHGQYLPSNSQYQTQPQPAQSQVNQTPQNHSLPQYQQQWSPQITQQGQQQQQQTSMQPQIRPTSPAVYPPHYMPSQAATPPPETLPNSMSMQMPYSGMSQPVPSRADVMPYGYGGVSRPAQPQPQPQPQPPHQHLKASFGAQPGDGYSASGPHQALSSGNAYMMYETEGGRPQHISQPHFPHGGYSQNQQPNSSSNMMPRPPQFMRNHPYNELVEKLVSMGYRGEHVASVIQRLEESGQPVDFNAVLDRLNVHPSGGSQTGWSG